MAEERLQKILARAGIASRRKAEELIAKGRVRVDGRVVTELGTKVDARSARVELDGKRLVAEPLVYGVLHKPRGMVSTLSDPEGRPTVRDLLAQVGVRVVPIGRLDFHTSGTLLFTNDGEFAAKLAHPSTSAPKVYVAKVRGSLDEKNLPRWTESIDIDGRGTRPADLRVLRDEGDKTWIQVTLREGRNRQVRRLGEHAGTPVMRLARVSQAGITSEGLRPGEWRHLSVDELTTLKKLYGVPKRVRAAQQATAKPKVAPRSKVVGAGRGARSAEASARPARPGTPARGAGVANERVRGRKAAGDVREERGFSRGPARERGPARGESSPRAERGAPRGQRPSAPRESAPRRSGGGSAPRGGARSSSADTRRAPSRDASAPRGGDTRRSGRASPSRDASAPRGGDTRRSGRASPSRDTSAPRGGKAPQRRRSGR